jgi:hypothetical protein
MARQIPVFNWVLFILAIMLLIAGVFLWLIAPAGFRILEATYNRGGAGACGTSPLYDRQGRLHEIPLKAEQQTDVPLYYGEAPLYSVGTRVLDPVYPDNCKYPESFPPEEVVKGEAFYPLVIESTVISQIGIGESTRLQVTALIQDNFSGLDLASQYLVRLNPDEKMDLAFKLDAPQFKYNQDPRMVELTIGQPAKLTWIIAPNENAVGQQWIGVLMERSPTDPSGRTDVYDYQVSVEVRPTSGIDPRLLSKLSLWGSLFMGGLTVVKTVYDMLPKASSQNETKGKAKPKKRKFDSL